MGVTYFKRYRMEIRLQRGLFVSPLTPANYQLVAWDDRLVHAHADTKYRSFCTEIDAHVFPCLGDLTGCQRLMEDISAKHGFLPTATWLAEYQSVPDGSSDYCGTVQGIADDPTWGSIQNLGVVPEHRGQGLGTALLLKALEGFCNAGLNYASLEVTAQNSMAVSLYRKLGFRRIKTIYKAVEVAYS